MNSRGQVAAMAFMIAIVIIILALAWTPAINEITSNVMNETYPIGGDGMNCSATTDNFVKAGCWVADINQAYFIGGLLAIAGIVIAARLIWGGSGE